jgi:hypothetical protein
LCYTKQDRGRAESVYGALQQCWTVSRAPENSGLFSYFLRTVTIEEDLNAASAVVVLWSPSSVRAKGVLNQAGIARERGILVPVTLQRVPLPLEYRDSPAIDLTTWDGKPFLQTMRPLLQAVHRLVSPTGGAPPWRSWVEPESHKLATESSPQPAQAVNGHLDLVNAKPLPAPALFLCYRRDDTQDAAGRLHDRLAAIYGSERVFMDIDSVPLGIDFVEHVTDQIAKCSAVIVMIGKQWLTIEDKHGRRRLENADDLVRAEIAAALKQNIPVIPVVVQSAAMPDAEDLPEDIRLLARRNGIQLRPDQWKEGVGRLLKELDPVMT